MWILNISKLSGIVDAFGIFLIVLLTVLSSLSLEGQMTNSGGQITIDTGAYIYLQGSLWNQNGGNILNAGVVEVQGDLVNMASLSSNIGSMMVFSGPIDIEATMSGEELEDVVITKDSSDILLMDDMTIRGELIFGSDDNQVILNTNNLVIDSSGSIMSYDDNEFIVTNNVGQLIKKSFNSYSFPIGYDETSYLPVTLQLSSSGDLGVSVNEHVYREGLNEITQVESDAVDATWIVSGSLPIAANLSLELQWSTEDELLNFDNTSCTVSRHDGSSWVSGPSDFDAASGNNPYLRNQSGFTDLGAFSILSELFSLPIELLIFDAIKENENVLLTWQTSSEINSSHFDIERSSDGISWQYLAATNAQGISNQISSYEYLDREITCVQGDQLYYRLKLVDKDGSYVYSPIRSVSIGQLTANISIFIRYYPNPTFGYINIDSNIDMEGYTIEIIAVLGQLMRSVNYENGLILNMQSDPSGVYTLRLTNVEHKLVAAHRIIKIQD